MLRNNWRFLEKYGGYCKIFNEKYDDYYKKNKNEINLQNTNEDDIIVVNQ